jgi:hypothetical protein
MYNDEMSVTHIYLFITNSSVVSSAQTLPGFPLGGGEKPSHNNFTVHHRALKIEDIIFLISLYSYLMMFIIFEHQFFSAEIWGGGAVGWLVNSTSWQ